MNSFTSNTNFIFVETFCYHLIPPPKKKKKKTKKKKERKSCLDLSLMNLSLHEVVPKNENTRDRHYTDEQKHVGPPPSPQS